MKQAQGGSQLKAFRLAGVLVASAGLAMPVFAQGVNEHQYIPHSGKDRGIPDLKAPQFQPPAPNKERAPEKGTESDPEPPTIVVSRLVLRYAFDHP